MYKNGGTGKVLALASRITASAVQCKVAVYFLIPRSGIYLDLMLVRRMDKKLLSFYTNLYKNRILFVVTFRSELC
jgi:hypothetical protein